jgi:hypothetical protein
VGLRIVSVSHLLRYSLEDPALLGSDAMIADRGPRDRCVERYVLVQLGILLLTFLEASAHPISTALIACYVLFEIFLALFSIVCRQVAGKRTADLGRKIDNIDDDQWPSNRSRLRDSLQCQVGWWFCLIAIVSTSCIWYCWAASRAVRCA